MKKILFLILSLSFLSGCGKDETEETLPSARIEKLYRIVLPHGMLFPFPAYVMRLSDGRDVYMIRARYSQDLYEGDQISYRISRFCSSEIAEVNGTDLASGGNYADDGYAEIPEGGLIASDPIEDEVADIFSLRVIYSVPFLPVKTTCIETVSDGRLLLVKDVKLSAPLEVGDRIVYNVYSLFPNEALAIKKLR